MLQRWKEKDHLTQLAALRRWYELLLDNSLCQLEILMKRYFFFQTFK